MRDVYIAISIVVAGVILAIAIMYEAITSPLLGAQIAMTIIVSILIGLLIWVYKLGKDDGFDV